MHVIKLQNKYEGRNTRVCWNSYIDCVCEIHVIWNFGRGAAPSKNMGAGNNVVGIICPVPPSCNRVN